MSYEMDAIMAEDEILAEAEDYENDIYDDYDRYPVDDYGEAFDDGYVSPIHESEFRDYSKYVMDAYEDNRQPLSFDEWHELLG